MSEKRVFIEVTELRAISSDTSQWMLMKRTKKTDKATGKPTGGYSEWQSYKYYGKYEQAVASLENELIRTSGAQTFTELHRSGKKIHAMLLEIHDKSKIL